MDKPESAYAIGRLSSYTQNFGLNCSSSPFVLEVYSDVNSILREDEIKSTSGHIYIYIYIYT